MKNKNKQNVHYYFYALLEYNTIISIIQLLLFIEYNYETDARVMTYLFVVKDCFLWNFHILSEDIGREPDILLILDVASMAEVHAPKHILKYKWVEITS